MKKQTPKPSLNTQSPALPDQRATPHIKTAVALVEAAKANLRATMRAYYAERGGDAHIIFEDMRGLPIPRLP